MGRSSSYDKELHPDWAWALAIQGKTDAEMAKSMGIARSTLNKWKNEHDEFRLAIDMGKEPSDAKVEKSLYQRATGYQYTERRVISTIDKNGRPTIERIETNERVALPDVTAIIYWLKNRRRKHWKDKWDVELDSDKDITFIIKPASERSEEQND